VSRVEHYRVNSSGSTRDDSEQFLSGNGSANHNLGKGLLIHMGTVLAVKRVEFISDRMSCIIPRGVWCNIVVPSVHAPAEDKSDDTKILRGTTEYFRSALTVLHHISDKLPCAAVSHVFRKTNTGY
jgi:hypothetical protein